MAALRAAPKRCGKHTIPEPFRMRNMASLGVAVEGRKAALRHSPVWLPRARYGATQMSRRRATARYLSDVAARFQGGGSLSTRCLGGNGWQQPNRPGSSAAQWASRANRGSGSVAGCRRRGLRSRSSRVRIEWRTAETVSLSCVDGLAKTWRAWKARSGRGQGVVVAGWSGRWIEYPTLSRILDPGHSKRVLKSRVSCPSTKVQGCEKKRRRYQVGLCRDKSLAQPLLAKKTDSVVCLVLELEPANPEWPSNGNFSNIRTVGSSLAARRSRYDSPPSQ